MSAAPSARTLVIGLESADLRLVEKWVGEGSLPFLGSMLRSCPLVTLRTPLHVLQTAVWPSLLTGVSRGRLGRYVLWSQIRSGTYDMRPPPTLPGSLRRYQEFLADRGIGSVLADIPSDVRLPGHRGMQIVDWSTEFHFGDCEEPSRRRSRRGSLAKWVPTRSRRFARPAIRSRSISSSHGCSMKACAGRAR